MCSRHPASWFCQSRFRSPDADVLPPWVDLAHPEPLGAAGFASLEVAFRAGDVSDILAEASDGSLTLIDLTNLPSALPKEVMADVFRIAAKKLHRDGVIICFIGPLLSGGVCYATGGDLERCLALLLRVAADAGLTRVDDWLADKVGESFAWFVAVLQHSREL